MTIVFELMRTFRFCNILIAASILSNAPLTLAMASWAVALRIDGDALWLVGVDDPHFYKLHNFDSALEGVPPDSVRVLLAHSPEVISEAGARGFALYLTGHTHGGQICLPNGWAPYINAHCPRRYTVGTWQYNGMKGYTSQGTGASGVFVRYFCPPEVTLHHLTANGDTSG